MIHWEPQPKSTSKWWYPAKGNPLPLVPLTTLVGEVLQSPPPCISSFAKIHLKLSENWFWRYSPKTQWFTEFSVKILSIFAIFALFLQNLEMILRKWNIFIICMPGCRFLINYSYLAIHLLLQIWGRKNCIHWVFSESLSF